MRLNSAVAANRSLNSGSSRLRRGASALLVVVLLVLVGSSPAGADSLDELRERKQAAEKKQAAMKEDIEELDAELEDTDKEMAAAYVRLKEIEGELPVAQAALQEAEGVLDKAKRTADDLAGRLEDAEADESELVERLEQDAIAKDEFRNSIAELARRAYRGEGNPDSMALIMGADSAEDFVNQFSLSQTAMRTQSNSLTELQQAEATSLNTQVRLEAVRDAITDLKEEADQAVLDAQAAATEAAERRDAVENLIEEQKATTRTIETRREIQLEERKKKDHAAQQLSDDILEIAGLTKKEQERIRKEQEEQRRKEEAARKEQAEQRRKEEAARKKAAEEAAKNNRPAPVPPAPKPPPSGQTPGRGFLSYPTSLVHITSSYGWRMHPVLRYERLHAGTDFRAYCGTPIMASADGTVVGSRMRGGYGNQVLVNHGTVNGANLMTSYNHLSRFAVSSGAQVKKGQVVGYSGTTGTSSACHLHFEVYINGATVNPMTML